MKWLIAVLGTFVFSSVAFAEIIGGTTYTLDLTNSKDARTKAKWSDADKITVTPEGLGWGNRDDEGSRDVWLETEPFGIGESWRPTSIASIRAVVERPGTSGLLYARYSADGKHWTTWQYLTAANQTAGNERTQLIEGTLRVPYREAARYQTFRMEYDRRDDVPWSSDEEALVKDILKREPTFFENSTPFIGYVQFLYEAQLRGGQRVKGLKLDVNWALGGEHHKPKDENAGKGRDVPWRFKLPSAEAQKGTLNKPTESVIHLAKQTAEKAGRHLSDYSAPVARPLANRKDWTWVVRFNGKTRARGDYFDVWVNDQTGKTELTPGE